MITVLDTTWGYLLTKLTLTIVLDETYYSYNTIVTMFTLIVITALFNPKEKKKEKRTNTLQ